MSDYCEWCGDEIEGGEHKTVTVCVGLCDRCGGLVPDDQRYEDRAEERCECPSGAAPGAIKLSGPERSIR